ncbi:lysosomal protective protein-like [Gastrophryne carolinensis]
MVPLLSCCMLFLVLSIEAAPQEDKILKLPGLDKQPDFQQYSGFLNISGGKHLHYWFVESQQDPSSSPVVLWLNGGPGCSSLSGFLSGHGPFLVQEDGSTLKYNQYAWNKVANMLYLESPAGVGFSYSEDKNYQINDTQAAQDNYLALREFFRLFPEFRKNEFFITGESYGGFYVPRLAVEVAKDDTINLKAIAIGNGLTSYEINDDSLLYFEYYHGLLDTSLWSKLQSSCCKGDKCHFTESESWMCKILVRVANILGSNSHLNIYNLYHPCNNGGPGEIRDLGTHFNVFHPGLYSPKLHSNFRENNIIIKFNNIIKFNKIFKNTVAVEQQPGLLMKLKGLSKLNKPIKLSVPCLNDTSITTYLNNEQVQKALHVHQQGPAWDICSEEVFQLYIREIKTIQDQYLEILKKGYRIFVYSGDVDMACNFLGVEWFVDSLKLDVESIHSPWWYKEDNKQIGGFVKQYTNLTLLTVKGAGHMVAEDNPEAALLLFTHFINNKPL